MRNVHDIKAEFHGRFSKRKIALKSDIQPDSRNPNHYCRVCDFTYSSRASFTPHLRLVHDIVFENRKKAGQLGDSTRLE